MSAGLLVKKIESMLNKKQKMTLRSVTKLNHMRFLFMLIIMILSFNVSAQSFSLIEIGLKHSSTFNSSKRESWFKIPRFYLGTNVSVTLIKNKNYFSYSLANLTGEKKPGNEVYHLTQNFASLTYGRSFFKMNNTFWGFSVIHNYYNSTKYTRTESILSASKPDDLNNNSFNLTSENNDAYLSLGVNVIGVNWLDLPFTFNFGYNFPIHKVKKGILPVNMTSISIGASYIFLKRNFKSKD